MEVSDLKSRIAAPLLTPIDLAPNASLIEVWIDETERRTSFLFEATRSNNEQVEAP
jgi:hypothetical protein